MDTIDGFTLTLLTAIGSSLLATIGALWLKLGKVQEEKDTLQREMRESLERNLTKGYEAINNNTIALTAFKEALKNG